MAARKKIPPAEQPVKEIPVEKTETRKLPPVGNPENTVMIGDTLIEIKPTKLKYQRNKTALFYKAFDMLPLPDILSFETGAFGDDRDGDKCVMDFLIAATDNEDLVVSNYDEMDTETIYKILSIFRRVNKIDEKEAKAKNPEAPRGMKTE